MARGVREQVLDDALGLRDVDRSHDRRQVGDEVVARQELGFLHDAPDQRPDVGLLQRGRDDAALEPVHVEQVRDEPLEAAGVAGDAAREIPSVGLVELRLLAPA